MKDSSQSRKTKKIIFIVTMAILSILLIVSIVFLVLAIEEERVEEGKKNVFTNESLKIKKFDIFTDINEFYDEIMTNIKNIKEVQRLHNCYKKELEPVIKQGNQTTSDIIQLIDDFYVRHKQDVEVVIKIILVYIRDIFQRMDLKFFNYIIKYFAGVFKDLKPNFEREFISIKLLCTSEHTTHFISTPVLSFNDLISELHNSIENFISNPLLIEVYQKTLNEEIIDQDERSEYNVYVLQFYLLFENLYIDFKLLFESKMYGTNLENNEGLIKILKNLEVQKEKIYEMSNSGNFELFDQEITKEIFKNLLFYVILMHVNLELCRDRYPNLYFPKHFETLQILDKLNLSRTGIFFIEILNDIFGILIGMIENQEYDANKDMYIIITNFKKIVYNKQLFGSFWDEFYLIVEPIVLKLINPREEVYMHVYNPCSTSLGRESETYPEESEVYPVETVRYTGCGLERYTGIAPETYTNAGYETYTGAGLETSTSEEFMPYVSGLNQLYSSGRFLTSSGDWPRFYSRGVSVSSESTESEPSLDDWPGLLSRTGVTTSISDLPPSYESVVGSSVTCDSPPPYESVVGSSPEIDLPPPYESSIGPPHTSNISAIHESVVNPGPSTSTGLR